MAQSGQNNIFLHAVQESEVKPRPAAVRGKAVKRRGRRMKFSHSFPVLLKYGYMLIGY